MQPLRIYIGYDAREAVAFHTCSNSIIRNCSVPVEIVPVALRLVKSVYKEIHTLGNGNVGYEPTNQFIFSRWLVPYLAGYKGLALFIDGDHIVRDGVDIKELFDLHVPGKAISVVKHDYSTKFPVKYLNQANEDYPRKNWSSVMLFDCSHFSCKKLTPELVQNSDGAYLHRLEWAKEWEIGELPIEWNWLSQEHGYNDKAKIVHYTIGTPCFQDYAVGPHTDEWHRERMLMNHSHQIGID